MEKKTDQKTAENRTKYLLKLILPFVAFIVLVAIVVSIDFWKYYDSTLEANKFSEKKADLVSSIISDYSPTDTELESLYQSRVLEVEVPENWQKYENDFLRFYYPADEYTVDDEIFDEANTIFLKKKSEDYDDKTSTYFKIRLSNADFDYENEEMFNRTYSSWYGRHPLTVSQFGPYSINGSRASVFYFKYPAEGFNPLIPGPFSMHEMVLESRVNTLIVSGYNTNLENYDDYRAVFETVSASVEDKQLIGENPDELPLGMRLPKDDAEKVELGKLYLDYAEGLPYSGQSDSPLHLIIMFNAKEAEIIDKLPRVLEQIGPGVKITYVPIYDFFTSETKDHAVNLGVLCAGEQGKVEEYLEELFTHEGKIVDGTEGVFASKAGLDFEKFSACVEKQESIDQLSALTEQATNDFYMREHMRFVLIREEIWYGEYRGWVGATGLLEVLEAEGQREVVSI